MTPDAAELGPRLVIAGTHSGVGKTTVATGLLAALVAAGHHPAAAKVGPDFIDPGYHAAASGRPPRNLDPWMCGPGEIAALAARAATGADLLVIEGVMGLFDGASDGSLSSTADVARLLDAPVVLVVDASAMSSSVAALVHGFAQWDKGIRVGGVILNRVGSPTHDAMLREALEPVGVPVLGTLGRDDRLSWRDRHLGLIPVVEDAPAVATSLAALAAAVTEGVDLAAVTALAVSAPRRTTHAVKLPQPVAPVRIGVAGGPAFSFTYTDTIDALAAAGADPVIWDPLRETQLPEGLSGLFIGGGFPEVYAAELSANRPLLDDLRAHVARGLPTWAECGGLLLLCAELDGQPMAGVLSARGQMGPRLTLGYRDATTRTATVVGPAATALRGHEFHYSEVDPSGHALHLSSRWGQRLEGFGSPTLLATYLHHHPGGDPSAVEAFVRSCAARQIKAT